MRRHEMDSGHHPDGGKSPRRRGPERHDGETWIEELEAAGRTAVFFLLLPVLLVALLLAGCGDSSRDRTVDARESGSPTVGTPARPTPASRTEPVKRPAPPAPSESGEPAGTGGSDEAEEKPFTGPVSFAGAEEAYDRGRYDEAHGMFSAYTKQYPDNPWGFYMVGLSAWKEGDLEEAVKALEKTVRMDSSHVKGWVNLARVRLDQGRPADARKAVSRAMALEGGERSDVFRVLGRVAQEEGELDEAVDAYRKALVLDPDDAWSMNNLALVHIHRGDFDRALSPLARAVQIRDDVPVFQNNLGTALEKVGRFSAATEAYRRAVESGDGYEKARASLDRIQGLGEPSGSKVTDLSELARGFVEEIEKWSLERTAALDTKPMPGPESGPPSETRPEADKKAGPVVKPEAEVEPEPEATPEAEPSPEVEEATDSDPKRDLGPREEVAPEPR